ncbi:MAG: ABC transporter permease, partial [Acidobacteriota bacterium]
FAPGEDLPGADPVIVIGYDAFRKRYGGDPNVVGRTVRVNGEPATLIGVMDEGFKFPVKHDVWVPLRLDPTELPRGDGLTLEVFGRLRDGVSTAEAEAEVSTLAARLAALHPNSNEGLDRVAIQPYIREFTPKVFTDLLWTMLGAVGFVLLIACANVASLLLTRASSRSKELATRLALGAERRRVVWDLLVEGLVLATGGALVGFAFAHWGGGHLARMVDSHPDPAYWVTPGLELPVLVFMTLATILSGLLAAMVPALQASRMDVNTLLKEDSRSSSGFRIGRFSRVAVIGQIALACVLLLGAGLMTRTIVNLRNADLGFTSDNLLTTRIGLSVSAYPEEADRVRFWDSLLESLAATPGVESVALTSSLPATGMGGTYYRLEGEDYPTRQDVPGAYFAAISPQMFDTFDITLQAGRAFTDQDQPAAEPVIVVNRSFAEHAWPGQNAVGQRLRFGRENVSDGEPGAAEQPWRTVVGVVQDAWMNDLESDDTAGIYAPIAQFPQRFLSLAVETRGEPMAFTTTLRQTVLGLDPDLPIYWTRTMEEVVGQERFFFDLFGGLFASFGGIALLLAAIGIYGVTAFSVGRRTQEIGLRMALGASPSNVLSMVLRQGTGRLAIGLCVGLLAGIGVSRLLVGFLIGVDPNDPLTFGAIALFLTAINFLACYIPALTAMRVEPVEALRN